MLRSGSAAGLFTNFSINLSLEDWIADYEGVKNAAAALQSLATLGSLLVGGWWVYRKYIRNVENFAHIESDADVRFVGRVGDQIITEVAGILENKGSVRQKIESFDLTSILSRMETWSRILMKSEVRFVSAISSDVDRFCRERPISSSSIQG